ncbi:MAG: hypothetical protein FJ225_09790 [Lentisphaerae bacterium]|nr:hypothetical protein [Lentisphaerota bacterium]
MKRTLVAALWALCGMIAVRSVAGLTVSDLTLDGEIDGENIVFTLAFRAEEAARSDELCLASGDIAYLDGDLPPGAELTRRGDAYVLKFGGWGWGAQGVRFRFAGRPEKEGDWRHTGFAVPMANVRRLAVVCDRDDLEIRFPGALREERDKAADGRLRVMAYLGPGTGFEVRWKPAVKKLEAELAVACDANSIVSASVGALRIDTVYTYRIIQGRLEQLVFDLPEINVTQVRGEDIREWRIDRADAQRPRLVVALGRSKESIYRLQVESEMILPKFPCDFDLPVLAPRDVIRASGFLLIGSDSAVKLQVAKAGGLTQVEPAAFPAVSMEADKPEARPRPSRSAYAYQYANAPYTFSLTADDIVTSFTADNRIVVRLENEELALDASMQIDVKDAPAREIVIETDPSADWTVTGISGENVSEADTDVREEEGARLICVPFKKAVTGTALINVRMEKTLAPGATNFVTPKLTVRGARAERGYLVAAAEQGVRLKVAAAKNLQEVFTGSAPMRVDGAQQAFRFKDGTWALEMGIERTSPSIHAEVFHLASLGEGVMYCSAAITYHIGGAPIQEFGVRVPARIEAVEFAGADIEGWTRDGDLCTVRLQTRIMGDYTLLATYDAQFDYRGADIVVGGVETVGTESEVGYVAVASSSSLKIEEAQTPSAAVFEIDRDEIPMAYAAPVTDPIIRSYKCVRRPHAVTLRVAPFDTERLLGQLADYVKLSTTLTRDGDAVTTALYFLKNASRQYLVARLPEKADLWSIRYVHEDGRREDVLSQQSDDGVLIPVQRPRDPNTALRIEVKYAQALGKLGFWRSGLRGVDVRAVRLPDTHATFASWEVEVPEDFTIAGVGGRLTRKQTPPPGGLPAALGKALRLIGAVLDGPRGRGVRAVLTADWGGPRRDEFTRTVNLSDEVPLDLRVYVVPRWMGESSSARMLAGGLLLGVAGTVAAWRRRGALLAAAALTVVAYAGAQSAAGRSVLAVAAALAGAAFVARYAARWAAHAARFVGRCAAGFARGAWRAAAWACGGVGRGVARAWRGFRASRERAYLRKLELRMAVQRDYAAPAAAGEGEAAESGSGADERGAGGSAAVWLVAALAFAALLAAAVFAGAGEIAPAPPLPPAPVVDSVELTAVGPATDPDVEQSARVKAVIRFRTDDALSFMLLPAPAVLVSFDLSSGRLELEPTAQGYVLHVRRAGEYRVSMEYQAPVAEQDGRWHLALHLLPNMRNGVTLRVPGEDMEIESPGAVLFRTRKGDGYAVAEAVFGPGDRGALAWRPRARETKLEEAVFFCEANTYAVLFPGLVEETTLLRYQIAQGEIKALRINIPAGSSVTAVRAPGLATWSYDPEKGLLDAILDKAVSGDFELTLVSQTASEGLPYTVRLGAIAVQGASRQRGALALAAPDTVQVRVGETAGLNPMNIEDFSPAAAAAAARGGKTAEPVAVRRAYRYHQAGEVAVTVDAERVLPELRVEEAGSLSISDERIVLSTRLTLQVAKSGVFAADLLIPAGYDVETITGPDVSHWDEEETAEGRGVKVHFSRRVTDRTEMNLVVAKTGKGIDELIEVPRVSLADARKHTGKLTVSGERGVRLMVEDHRGVDTKKASEEGIRQQGVLVFEILRPGWSIRLRTEVLQPLVKPEALQWVDLAEGMLQCRSYIRYRIENAGMKTFVLRSPVPGISLAVTGPNIARVHETDPAQGVWQVDLHNKVENLYALSVSYQVPYAPEGKLVSIEPLRAVGTDGQRGYVVVTCAGRVQVEPAGGLEGLKVEDARSIPAEFGAGDMSGAILCYRSVRDDYRLDLSVVRHGSADVLPASIDRVRMTSVVSRSRRILTRMTLDMTVGNLRFLKFSLPAEADTLWTALVNGKEVNVSRDAGLYCIPLEEEKQTTKVEIVSAGKSLAGALTREQRFDAPRFVDLPLDDIEWTFFVPPALRYYGFGGTLEHREERGYPRTAVFNAALYDEWNKRQREEVIQKAKQELQAGEQLIQAGRRRSAMRAFEQALNYSQGQSDLNEDARVQLRNMVKQQVKIGLVNRRDALRVSRNIQDAAQAAPSGGFQGGEYTQEYAQTVEGQLSSKDNAALEMVADRIIDQQAAAAGVVAAIRVTMPEHGEKLLFTRALQIDPKADLTVIFKAGTGRLGAAWRAAWPAAVLFALLWWLLARRQAARED